MQNTSRLPFFYRLFIGVLRVINPDAADLVHYRKQCEIYEKKIIPEMTKEAREMILRLGEAKREAESAFYELNERYTKVQDDLFSIQGKYKALKERQHVDPLTQLLDRNGIKNAFHREAGNIHRTATRMKGQPDISILLIDVDKFKEVNDVNGHDIGDKALTIVASIMKSSFREGDIPGRIGGDEFLEVLPNASIAQAQSVAEKFRAAVQNHPFLQTLGAGVTVSIGVAKADLDRYGPSEAAMLDAQKRADVAMYKAKRIGRNKVCVAE